MLTEIIELIKEQATAPILISSLVIFFFKDFCKTQIVKFYYHLKKKQKIYYIALGSCGTLLFIAIFVTGYKNYNTLNQKIALLEKNLQPLKNGESDANLELFKSAMVAKSKQNMLNYRTYYKLGSKEEYEKFWLNNHITIIMGKIILKKSHVYFKYLNVVGKDPKQDKIENFDFYEGASHLFTDLLTIKEADVKALREKRICINTPVLWNRNKDENSDRCHWLETLGETIKLKVMNNVQQVLYVIVPYMDKDNSRAFFWFSIESKEKFYNTTVYSYFALDMRSFRTLAQKYVNSKILSE